MLYRNKGRYYFINGFNSGRVSMVHLAVFENFMKHGTFLGKAVTLTSYSALYSKNLAQNAIIRCNQT